MKKVIRFLKLAGLCGVLGFIFDRRLLYLLPAYAIALVIEKVYAAFTPKKEMAPGTPDLSHYYTTLYLSILNPFVLGLSLLQYAGQLLILVKCGFRLPSPATFHSKVNYILPFKGTWKIIHGGITEETSHSWGILTQRYAYDFVITDEQERSFRGGPTSPDDYYCFGQDIVAPADGVVVAVNDGICDYRSVGDYSIDWKTRDFRGNFIIIRHAAEEYSFLAHLQHGSIKVKKGDVVTQGSLLASCGNTGFSTEPHLHYHLQRGSSFWFSPGLPVRFNGQSFVSGPQSIANPSEV
jgi:murein DD-endopeptidase MepM/ murein hydrolase activator NlpD